MTKFRGYTTIDRRLGFSVLDDIEIAKRDLLNHFYTSKGERLASPEFGSILPQLVFEPLDDRTIDEVEDDVREIVGLDPRWELDDLDIEIGDHQITCRVKLIYTETTTPEELFLEFIANNEN